MFTIDTMTDDILRRVEHFRFPKGAVIAERRTAAARSITPAPAHRSHASD